MFPIDAHYKKGPLKKLWKKRNYNLKKEAGLPAKRSNKFFIVK